MHGDVSFRPRPARVRAACAAGLVLWLCGCAYFNTFYNAKQLFKEAERTRTRQGGSAAAGSYDACIKKCLDLIRYHSKSKYVDDAMYMIGVSHLYRDEYVQAQDSFQDLLDRFPESDFAERAHFHMGLASLLLGDAGGAAAAFRALKERFPESEYIVEAAFRTAEMRLDSRDYDAARDALREFMRENPDSRFVVDAQVQIARTYYDEQRYEDSRREYAEVLERKLSDELRYEAELHIALAKREEAEIILSDPALYTADEIPEGLTLELPEADEDTTAASAGGETGATEAEADTTAPGVGGDTTEPPVAVPEGPDQAGPSQPAPPGGAEPDPPAAPGGVEASAAGLVPAAEAIPESLQALRQQADRLLAEATRELDQLRKRAAKLERELQHRTELAVTLALVGEPDEAIGELDQIARTEPRTDIAANALYEIGEIHRRRGELQKAMEAYDNSLRARRGSEAGKLAQRKSVAIRARSTSLEQLRAAPQVLHRWRVAKGFEEADEAAGRDSLGAEDSLKALIDIEVQFEELAGHLFRVAEIDLLDLDQPRLALREFQQLLDQYPGNRQSARAAFAIAWIYDNILLDPGRALEAYETVAREYPDSAQAREALAIVAGLQEASNPPREVTEPSSRP
ncbi:MAG: tetratricopeptide repeat protein [Candidatus Krumholzibacteriia bacterium]